MVDVLLITSMLLTAATALSPRKSSLTRIYTGRGFKMPASTLDEVAVTSILLNKNPLLNGGVTDIFQDSPEEVIEPKRLTAEGPGIPSWLRGTLLRNGPGLFGALEAEGAKNTELRRFDHAFDGPAKISRYSFNEDNTVDFSTRFLDSTFYKALKGGNMPAYPPYTGRVNPPFTTYERLRDMVTKVFDNTVVNVHQVGGKSGPWVGVTDAPAMVEFDPDTLETKGLLKAKETIVSLGGVEIFSTAHPHFKDGYTYNLFTELRPVPIPFLTKSSLFHLVRTNADLKREVVGSVETGGSDIVPYIHDFGVSENYAIVAVWPLRMNLSTSFDEAGMMRNMVWDGDKGVNTKIHVFDIKSNDLRKGPVATFEAPPMFAYHHVNAYEIATLNADGSEGSGMEIVLDISGYDTPDIVNGEHPFALISNVKDPELRKKQTRDARWYRLRLPMETSTTTDAAPVFVSPSILRAVDKDGKVLTSELVRMDPRRKFKKHRYSYGLTGFAGNQKDGVNVDAFNDWAIVKLDHDTADQNNKSKESAVTSVMWSRPSCFPSEAVFVPNPTDSAQEEDSGVLLSAVYDGTRRESFLLVLDARTMTELARFYTGIAIPVSFHGQFIQK